MGPRGRTLHDLRRFAVARSFVEHATLARAVEQLGFVQADPIRAPARAQDLTLRHRVAGYRAGDLERSYQALPVEEEYFINYGFLLRRHVALMHPRTPRRRWDAPTRRRAAKILEFVLERGEVHPRDVDARFAHGKVVNYWGGSSNATTQLLDSMHYRGLLRVVRREAGIRVYAAALARERDGRSRADQADALLALAVRLYAPVPSQTLGQLASRLRYAAPQLSGELRHALTRARKALAREPVEGTDWHWPADETIDGSEADERVRFVTPFDPLVWDRRRFELFWGWPYRFEAYTPEKKRKLGYYALPLAWRDDVIGWGNLTHTNGELRTELGYVSGKAPRDRTFRRELDDEIAKMRLFLTSR